MAEKQLLHLVFGGELESLKSTRFKNPQNLHVVGMFANYKLAHEAWLQAARATIDNAHQRYFIVHVHRLLDPNAEKKASTAKAKPKTRKPRTAKPKPKVTRA